MLGCAKLGMNVRIATPMGYECNADILRKTQELAKENGTAEVFTTKVADEAVKGSDVIVTDTWVSMGQEEEYAKRIEEFAGYEVNIENCRPDQKSYGRLRGRWCRQCWLPPKPAGRSISLGRK